VAVVGVTDLEGWVSNDFVTRQVARRSGPAVLSRSELSNPPPPRVRAAPAPRKTAARTTPARKTAKQSTARTRAPAARKARTSG
jgi:hypothetical protein